MTERQDAQPAERESARRQSTSSRPEGDPGPGAGVDVAFDVAGSGILTELIKLAGSPEHVITVAEFAGAQRHGVRFGRGDSGRTTYALAEVVSFLEVGQFILPVGETFPLVNVAEADRVGESGNVRGKIVVM